MADVPPNEEQVIVAITRLPATYIANLWGLKAFDFSRILSFLIPKDLIMLELVSSKMAFLVRTYGRKTFSDALLNDPNNAGAASLVDPNSWSTFQGLKFHLCALKSIILWANQQSSSAHTNHIQKIDHDLAAAATVPHGPIASLYDLANKISESINVQVFMIHEQKELQNVLNNIPQDENERKHTLHVIRGRIQKVLKLCVRSDREFTMLRHRAINSLHTIFNRLGSTPDQETAQAILKRFEETVFAFSQEETDVINRYTKRLYVTYQNR